MTCFMTCFMKRIDIDLSSSATFGQRCFFWHFFREHLYLQKSRHFEKTAVVERAVVKEAIVKGALDAEQVPCVAQVANNLFGGEFESI